MRLSKCKKNVIGRCQQRMTASEEGKLRKELAEEAVVSVERRKNGRRREERLSASCEINVKFEVIKLSRKKTEMLRRKKIILATRSLSKPYFKPIKSNKM